MSIVPQLEELVQIVIGNTSAWNLQIQNSDYWYEFLPGYLFYTNPVCKHFELGTAASSWLDQWVQLKSKQGIKPKLTHLDKVLLSLMENELHQVIHSIQLMADNKWFVTHFTDLLFNSGQLQRTTSDTPAKLIFLFYLLLHFLTYYYFSTSDCVALRDSLLYDFGSSLMSRNSLWQLGIDYLQYCAEEGK